MIGPRPHSKCSDLEPRHAVPWAESFPLTSPEATNLPEPSLGTADVIAFETKLIYPIWNSPAGSFAPLLTRGAPGCGSCLFTVAASSNPSVGGLTDSQPGLTST